MNRLRQLWSLAGRVSTMALLLAISVSGVSAETLMMPNRDMLMGANEVVWGITTLPNGAATTYTIDFGDGSSVGPVAVVDRSYIAVNHIYALSGTYTATLTVINGATTESATVTLQVYNSALLSPFDLRNLNVNRAIQDGLRYLWQSQANRTTFDTTIETFWDWGSFDNPGTALAVLAFENHGYKLPDGPAAPTGIYQKYAVRRGFNYVLARLTTLNIPGLTPAGNDACVVYGPAPCTALYAQTTSDPGYENGIVLLPFAGSGALNRVNTEVLAANVVGKTFGEILQRIANASFWGQGDSSHGRGGWDYSFNSSTSDGSTNGWELLGLLDAEAAGGTVPAWVKTEYALALVSGLNNDGSFDYRTSGTGAGTPTSNNAVNVAKTGVGVQGMFFTGRPAADADLANAKAWIAARWQNQSTGQSFVCQNGTYNKGCGYGMFNVFKGFRLYGIQTLAGVARPAGPGTIPADDWYADYVDWLLANQNLPQSTTGGQWSAMAFSSQTQNGPAQTALGLLILSPTALVLPDETRFSQVGLKHGSPLTVDPQTNPVGTSHTVTGITEAANGNPIAGVTVTFRVISGPNTGVVGTGQTGANGQATFTYMDTGGPGADEIQAFVGALESNKVVKNWVAANLRCDADADGDVDTTDLGIIRAAMRQNASGPADPRDGNGDGVINIADVRYCQLRLTPVP